MTTTKHSNKNVNILFCQRFWDTSRAYPNSNVNQVVDLGSIEGTDGTYNIQADLALSISGNIGYKKLNYRI